MTTSLQENEKTSNLKGIIVVIIAFLLIPLMTITIMYASNENFRYTTNNFLRILPGNAGGYFRRLPTKEEKENIKVQIAKFYIALEEDRLVDKLLIIKGEDNNLYDDLLILLSKENPMKMRSVKENLRNTQLQSNVLGRVLEEINQEKATKINEYTDYYASLKVTDAILEIERTYKSGELKSEELPLIFENFSTDASANLLIYLDDSISERALYGIKEAKRREIEKKIQEIHSRQNELIRLANIYEKESLEEKMDDLGTNNKFRAQDLAVIYKNMSIKSGGQILADVKDNDFITNLYDQIDAFEMLNKETKQLSSQLAEAIEIFQNYDTKVKELVGIYEKMSLQELTNIIEEMAKSNRNYQRYLIGDEEIIFTEEQLVLDVISQLKPKKAAELLEQLKTQRSVDLSKKYIVER
ncbi:hypothetical protein SAMN05446037_1001294 [Anaerovirgula multivorans]|uniref:Flagellar motility protein MotE, a chaperone for MotC folding n=1 Tax=Anaerovirgula multivorans TaxID=312168 RepID=A0A239A2B8_9FIRM|nr:hypothetical protein [Anaerovirgula multivorans]SNR89787.1 hypothetical protein SAMN05446037_1001294 [Anaerovirgula multivorans]